MREKILGIWSIWKFPLSRESRIGFLLSMAAIDLLICSPIYLIPNHLMGLQGTTALDPTTSLDLAIQFMARKIVI